MGHVFMLGDRVKASDFDWLIFFRGDGAVKRSQRSKRSKDNSPVPGDQMPVTDRGNMGLSENVGYIPNEIAI